MAKPCYLAIEARLPQAAGLELSARLLAARPHWDPELTEDGLNFVINLGEAELDAELSVLEDCCRQVERPRQGGPIEIQVRRAESPAPGLKPEACGPFRLHFLKPGQSPPPPRADRLFLSDQAAASARLWAGEALLLSALAEHLSPPPGAPETRGRPSLIWQLGLPLAPVAAIRGASGPISFIGDEANAAAALALAKLNGEAAPLHPETAALKSLARSQKHWAGRFGLIAVHLSPYLAARGLKILSDWLAPDGALIISGFAPGPQTALLLRAAARCSLALAESSTEGLWAAMKLRPTPKGEELPPLSGTVVPELMEAPAEEGDKGEGSEEEPLILAQPDDELDQEPGQDAEAV